MFTNGLQKTAVIDLPASAMITATAPIQTAVPGTLLRETASTGQRKKINVRSYDQDRNGNPALRHDANNSRHGGGRKANQESSTPEQEA